MIKKFVVRVPLLDLPVIQDLVVHIITQFTLSKKFSLLLIMTIIHLIMSIYRTPA